MSARHRSSALLLAACCLMLSPAEATAAAPNQLSRGEVTPRSGTTQTTFIFSVAYGSKRDFPATSVVALIAGRSVRLSLVSGTPAEGSFRGSATLPAGKWSVRFEAEASQGPPASLDGPTIVVSPTATPKPVPAPTPKPASATPVPTPRPATATTPPPPRSTQPPADSTTPAASAAPADSPRQTEPSSSDGGEGGGAPGPDSSASTESPGPLAVSPPGDGPDGSQPWAVILGSGAVGLLLLVAWRRRGNDEEMTTQTAALADQESNSSSERSRPPRPVEDPTTEDPILAAMGVGASASSEPHLDAPLTRSVTSGPGERTASARSRWRAG